jgi:hypothetical protein
MRTLLALVALTAPAAAHERNYELIPSLEFGEPDEVAFGHSDVGAMVLAIRDVLVTARGGAGERDGETARTARPQARDDQKR